MRHPTSRLDPRLGDDLIERYVEWREECSAVQCSYEQWREASSKDRPAAFAAYKAALDREERASDLYAALIRQLTPALAVPG